MAAAVVIGRVPRDPLANSAGAFRNFGTALGQAARAIRTTQTGITKASRTVDRVKSATGQTGKGLKQFGTGATAAGRAATALGKQAGTANTGFLKSKAGAQQSTRLLKNIKRQSDGATKSIALQSKGAGVIGRITGVLGSNLNIASKIMTAVNLVMKTNPFVLVATLLAPFATQLIELATDSKVGQQLMETVFTTVGELINAALTVIVPVVTAYLTVIKAEWNAVSSVIKPVVKWVTKSLPGGFRKVSSAMEKALHGMGDFLQSGFQMVVGVVKGPLNGIISFANWVIDGLNSLSFSILGKKFGVHLSKIPMLAQGGVVSPRDGGVPVILAEAGEAEAVLPLSQLDRLLARTAEAARATKAYRRAPRVENYYEPENRGSYGIAEDLLFLARTA
ncbi:hypothetical protein AB0I49_06090 [Streptomyces sp. NPDC050617]|uniref:hypothetical protein n=1 Tax=Streptomyces sp. NPDC050617 TaxID=3154628 RepID=UPI00343B9BB9